MKKVAKLIESRQKINKKIEDIQKRCPHFNTTIKQIRENVDSTSPSIRYVCDECSKMLGYPNQQEIKKYLNG